MLRCGDGKWRDIECLAKSARLRKNRAKEKREGMT